MASIVWYPDGLFWRHHDPEWAIKLRGADSQSKGDVIFNTLKRIIDQEDFSRWAYNSFEECGSLLIQGKRWPDRMNQHDDCKGWICFYWQKIKFFVYKQAEKVYKRSGNKTAKRVMNAIHCKHGHQKNVTRDGWTMLFVAASKMNRAQFFHIKVRPGRLWRPNWMRWIKYLRTGDWEYRERYLKYLRPSNKEYVQRLHYYINMTL